MANICGTFVATDRNTDTAEEEEELPTANNSIADSSYGALVIFLIELLRSAPR